MSEAESLAARVQAARDAQARGQRALQAGDRATAERELRAARDGFEALGPPGARWAAAASNLLAACVGGGGRRQEALDLFEDAAALAARAGAEADVEVTLENLADHARGWGRWPAAAAALGRLVELRRERDGPDAPGTWDAVARWAVALFHAGDREAAARAWREVLADALGPRLRAHRADAGTSLGRLALEDGDPGAAVPLLEEAATQAAAVRGEDHPQLGDIHHMLGAAHRELGEYAPAEEHLLEGLRIRLEHFGQEHPVASESLNGLGVLYRLQDDAERAGSFFRRALEIRRVALGAESAALAPVHANLGELLLSVGHPEEARPHLERVRDLAGDGPEADRARELLARCAELAEEDP